MNKPAAGEFFWNFNSFRSNFGGVSTFSAQKIRLCFQHWGFHDADDLKQPRPT